MLAAAVASADSVLFAAAFWGYLASWLNEVIKQDKFPTWANTLIANGVVLLTSILVAWEKSPTLTFSSIGHAALGAFGAAVINHSLFLKPTGIGAAVQTATSLPLGAKADPAPVDPPLPPPPAPNILPPAPSNIDASAGNGLATVSWMQDADTTGTVTGYLITPSSGTPVVASAGRLKAVVPFLTNGTNYTFTVSTITDQGAGSPSAPSNVVTPKSFTPDPPVEPPAEVTVPLPPTNQLDPPKPAPAPVPAPEVPNPAPVKKAVKKVAVKKAAAPRSHHKEK